MTLSGMAAQVGVDNRNGIILAAKHKKTLLGGPIELIIEDVEGKPETAVRKAEMHDRIEADAHSLRHAGVIH